MLAEQGFALSYNTNIPRQAGLSGSSAIVKAALECCWRGMALLTGEQPICSSCRVSAGMTLSVHEALLRHQSSTILAFHCHVWLSSSAPSAALAQACLLACKWPSKFRPLVLTICTAAAAQSATARQARAHS